MAMSDDERLTRRREASARWRAAHTEESKAYQREYQRQWSADNPDKVERYRAKRSPESLAKRTIASREYSRKLRKEDPEKVRAAQRKWIAENRERYYAYSRASYARNRDKRVESQKVWRQRNLDHIRDKDLQRHYGISLADYQALLNSQRGVCKLCEGPARGRGTYHVDHDHTTGKIRGLLCHSCNTAIGLLKENCALIKRVLGYLMETS